MTAQSSRLMIFGLWFGTMVLCLLLVFAAVPICGDIPFMQALQVTTPIASLYVPILTAFALFWFHPGASPNKKRLSKERWYVALALTLFFQILMLGGVAIIVYFIRSPDSHAGVFENIVALIHWISIFSPIATAPSAYLLGIERIETG
jgi:hypothetical protein